MKTFTLTFNDFTCYRYLRNGISDFIKDMVADDSTLVEVVLNEAVNNAIKHGRNKKVLVRVKIQKNGFLVIRVKDRGKGFAVDETIQKVNETNMMKDINYTTLKESGRGLFIMQQVMDKVIYNKKGNDVLLVKNIQRRKQIQ
ncbi:ATP-binding protein [Schinkia azotoformans]|uniref:Anti-sigma regulatory factor, serine/threonine protein kinase n=1 Tax=Schinkia azotoformans LMG 9581 TaxID=1131731 RepID=K6DF80_SCHAZ|nr:ATP-binding protein [Schinkia azotoformans]EKN71197.1 anti-sigma regulatory factor, serine/threonine protein kinase [Schinkia azotoformans LMG 9581]MEC1638910.1 ATP-binding protein [Schinkia azotoformans]MEC1720936.1 ATP-binding protein [Schinkia azotoformans]MEC1946875.1 ATP-binding protein [Schinkia azotoformans]MED4353112.1 ATP-binding protein [Schinkia azotoformans]